MEVHQSWAEQEKSQQVLWVQKDFRTVSKFKFKLTCCSSCTFCCRPSTKERFNPHCKVNKVLCPACHKCLSASCCSESTCRGQIAPISGTWAVLGAGTNLIKILREGYTLPFRIQLNLTRSLIVISGYVHPCRNSCLTEALHALMQKNAVDL